MKEDRARALFETLLVLDGRPVRLRAHLRRLRASARALGWPAPPPVQDVRRAIVKIAAASGLRRARCRLLYAPRDSRVAPISRSATHSRSPCEGWLEISPAGLPGASDYARGVPVRLKTVSRPPLGALARHKVFPRPAVMRSGGPEWRETIFVDRRGRLLEGARTNVFVVKDGVVFTPPLDGRILPGLMRAQVLRFCRRLRIPVREAPVTRRLWNAADERFLTNALVGVLPVRPIAGRRPRFPIARRLRVASDRPTKRS